MASFTFNPYASENSISKILKKKQNKTKINLIDGLRDIYIKPDTVNVVNIQEPVRFNFIDYQKDGYAHNYELILTFDKNKLSSLPALMFPDSINWIKDLDTDIEKKYYIVIEDNTAMWTSIVYDPYIARPTNS